MAKRNSGIRALHLSSGNQQALLARLGVEPSQLIKGAYVDLLAQGA